MVGAPDHPRARVTRVLRSKVPLLYPFTPAFAGNTAHYTTQSCARPDQPHAREEHLARYGFGKSRDR